MESKNMKVAEVRISYKSNIRASERPKIDNSQEVYSVLLERWNFEIIEF